MRKILRAKMRYVAEKSDGKTIKVFRSLWKNETEKRNPVKDTGTKIVGTKLAKKKKQSMLKRTI